MRNKIVMLTAIAAWSAGCTNARISQGFTSGAVGCPRDEITIYNETASGPMGSMHAWEAECRGKHFVCSYHETSGVNCSEALAGAPEPKLPDSSKEVRVRVAELNEYEGAMSPTSQDDAMKWLERNQAATDDEAVSAMIDLCELMSNRGSRPFASRLEAIEKNAANKDVRSECAEAREEAEERD